MKRQIAMSVIVLSLLFPTGIFIHECGHYAAARSFGWAAELTPAYVPFQADDLTPARHILFLAAGLICDVVYILVGLVWIQQYRRDASRVSDWNYWFATVFILFAVRWFIAPFTGSISDEAKISAELGLHFLAIPILSFLPGLAILSYLTRIHWRRKTVVPLVVGMGAAFCSVGLWINVVGPIVLSGL